MNEGERRLCEWQYGKLGSFFTHLWEAISHADQKNLDRLARGYPEDVRAYEGYAHTNYYWENLQREYLNQS